MKRLLAVAVLLAMLAAAGLWWIQGRGFSARQHPTRIEEVVALQMRSLATPRDAKELRNPLARNAATLNAGLGHFADHCAICHANDGSGKTAIGSGLYPKPPDLRLARTQQLTDGELFYIIENGVRLTGMPAFGGEDSEPRETWALVTFIRHLPQITPAELGRMEELNPKSPEEMREEQKEREFLEGGPKELTPSQMQNER